MADKRAFFKMDVGYLTNPKVATVAAERPTAVLLHIASLGYAAQHLTDGIVPIALLLRLAGADQDDARALFEAGLWYELGGGKAEIHDYLKHQRSSTDVKSASTKAKQAADARWNASSMPDAMPDAMRPASAEVMPREKRERKEPLVPEADAPGREDVNELCELLADRIEANGSKRPKVTKGWRDAARLMLDRDQRSRTQVEALIRWCQDDDFWKGNVLSMPKFRDKYDQLRLKAESEGALRPERNPGQVDDWLRSLWETSNVQPIVERTGIRYEQPDLPLDVVDSVAFFRDHRRQWMRDNRDAILAALRAGAA